MTLLEGTGKMIIAWLGQRGRKGLMAITIAALFLLNLNGALAAGGDSAWHGSATATTLSSSSASIGDRVWHDQNGDGKQELFLGQDWDYEGFNNVHVHLYRDNGDGIFDRNTDTELGSDITESGTSSDGYPDGIYGFEIGPGEYWVWVNESTLPPSLCGWYLTTESNPRKVTYTGSDDFSIDFGYEPLACPAYEPTAVTLSSFMASSTSRGASFRWPWLAVLATLAAGGTLWIRRQSMS